MDNERIKRYSVSLIIREMQIKTTMTLHISEWPSSINSQTTSAGEDVEKGMCTWCTVGGNADWGSHCGKQHGVTSKI